MSLQIPLKQLEGVFSGFVRINAFSASGADDVVTTPVTTALSTAGRGGVSVPLQASTGEDVVGVVTTGANNRVEIYAAATEQKLDDGAGNEVYGRLTQSGGVYTLSYFSLVDGVETSYTGFSSNSVDFEFAYRFDFARLPADFAIALNSRNVNSDPGGAGASFYPEQLTPTGTNTLPDLTKTPVTNTLKLIVNGQSIDGFGGGSAPFSVSGKTVTWSAANAGWNLATTDRVIAEYFTFE